MGLQPPKPRETAENEAVREWKFEAGAEFEGV